MMSSENTAADQGTYQKAAAFYCVDDNRYLFAENIDNRFAPASVTKLLTSATALKYMSADDIITVGDEYDLVKPYSSLCYILPGQKLKLFDLLTGLLLPSGNEAAYSIAAAGARTAYPDTEMTSAQAIECFVGLMNEYALSIGMNNSFFVHPEGWDDDRQYITIRDMITLGRHILSIPVLRSITGTHSRRVTFESGERITWTNTNLLLNPESEFYCKDAVGFKTGTTDKAGASLLAAFVRNQKTYISYVTGCEEKEDRYVKTLEMLKRFT